MFLVGATIVINLYYTRPSYSHGFSVNVALFVSCSPISGCSYIVCFRVLSRNLWKDLHGTHFSVWINDWFITVKYHLASIFLFIIQKKVLSDEPALNIFRLIFCLMLTDIII